MRILVHGGTQFVVRYRVGDWSIPTKILEDKYGLPLKDWAFGLGVLESESFIILRRRQIGTANREYPFTVLLSPDNATWERFDWNAAKLIVALLSEGNQVRERLFESPESIRSEDVVWLANELRPTNILPQSDLPPIAALIVGGIFEAEPVAVNSSKQIPYPTLSATARVLESLPPFLRNGNGWLVGGNVSSARLFGVNFVFNFQEQQIDAKRSREVEDRGYRIIHNWQTVNKTPEISQSLLKYTQTPVWLWEKSIGENPSEFFEQLNGLAGLVEKREIASDEEFLKLRRGVAKTGVLATEQRDQLIRLTRSSTRVLSAKETEFVFEELERGSLNIGHLPIQNLDHEIYCGWLVRNNTFPSQSKIPLQLDQLKVFVVCSGILNAENQLSNIPILFGKLLKEFPTKTSQDWIEQLAEIAFKKTSGASWFEIWLDYRQEHFFVDHIKRYCVAEARKQLRAKTGEWKEAYLLYGADAGGKWLSENSIDNETASLLVKLIINETGSAQYRGEATRWLQGLSLSPLRSGLALETKDVISRLSEPLAKTWSSFRNLSGIFSESPPISIDPAHEEELEYLNSELNEMMQARSHEYIFLRSKLLRRLLGDLPFNVQQIVIAEKAKAEKANAEKAKAEKAKLQKTKSQKKKQEKAPVRKEKPADLVAENDLDKDSPLARVANQAEKLNCALVNITVEICRILSDEEHGKDFLRGFWYTNGPGWKDIFPILPLDLRGQILLVLRKRDLCTTETFLNTFDESLKAESQTVFQHALWETLLYSKARKDLRNKILAKRGSNRKLVEELTRLVNLPIEGQDWTIKSSESSFISEAARKGSLFKRIKQWFINIFRKLKNLFADEESNGE